ncbi:MAG: FHA domain-containing protein [Coriobacteriaceae bacterium]|nr:FHA domain-containing protein [Coriobacteriaceae bacterium]
MNHGNSPSSVMYAELKQMGMSNRDVAAILLDSKRTFGESPLQNRIESRTQLSRSIVHVAPGSVNVGLFRDFRQSVPVLMGDLTAAWCKRNKGDADEALCARFAGESGLAMQRALATYNLDSTLYRNILLYIQNLELSSEANRALLYLMHFVVTGCTGDPALAARIVEQTSIERFDKAFQTPETRFDRSSDAPVEGQGMGLMRLVAGRMKGADAFYRLDEGEEGTIIGTFASGPNAINDVDVDVSREHARVYCKHGRWFVVGMGSLNGTMVISGADKSEHVVEPPMRERPVDYTPVPVEIFPTDTLCFGATTRFMVLPVMS